MRKFTFLLVVVFLFSAVAHAQKDEAKATSDYSGSWTLDVSKSDTGGRVKSMTMVVTQTGEKLSYERTAEMNAPPEGQGRGAGGGGRGPGGGGGRGPGGGGFGGPNQSAEFDLSGNETKVAGTGQMGGEIKYKAKTSDGKVSLKTTRELNTQMGALSIATTEKWELSADGKTLTIKSDTETPRGVMSTKMVFTKNEE